MSLTSWAFAGFLPLSLLLFHAAPLRYRTGMLALLSLAFYASAFPAQGLLLVAVTVAVWWVSKRMKASQGPRRWLAWGVTGIVALLVSVKYLGLLAQTLDSALKRIGVPAVPVPSIVAPLGISFVCFGLIHYLVCVYRGEADIAGPLEMGAFVFFFPTIISGPIKRYPDFLRELRTGGASVDRDDIAAGAGRVVIGLAKKVVLADTLLAFTGPLYRHGAGAPLPLAIAVYAYAFYIYLDFSGYCDMAIGISRLFGFHIIENFNWPYLRRNVAEFWSAWHISLTKFITQYIFIPMGGSREGRWKTTRNTLIAMAISGMWHGVGWHFVAWGLYHGVGLVITRWWRETTGWVKRHSPAFARVTEVPFVRGALHVGAVVLTFNFVALGWVLFAVSFGDAMAIYQTLGRAALTLLRIG